MLLPRKKPSGKLARTTEHNALVSAIENGFVAPGSAGVSEPRRNIAGNVVVVKIVTSVAQGKYSGYVVGDDPHVAATGDLTEAMIGEAGTDGAVEVWDLAYLDNLRIGIVVGAKDDGTPIVIAGGGGGLKDIRLNAGWVQTTTKDSPSGDSDWDNKIEAEEC